LKNNNKLYHDTKTVLQSRTNIYAFTFPDAVMCHKILVLILKC